MTRVFTGTSRCAALAWLIAAAVACDVPVQGQEAASQPQPPPEVQRLVELMQAPEKVRTLMQDPAKMLEVMESLQSEKVQDYLSDPNNLRELMRGVDLLKIQEAMREVDPAQVRIAMFMG